ncbi:non-ribosomal peptide synthetase [Micromonospora radicis]|uniref:Non-ribosomal peptide synthetase n=1 Tax=Micromonospora radicis TaxID=1894971 RepID=A0A418N1J9_9ACTN|nr:non-ribosomal peptide synthetase [Micromonospora radicis]RIV41496.1 non-ribosomal peptide synthetase [Micromonospora radicis]
MSDETFDGRVAQLDERRRLLLERLRRQRRAQPATITARPAGAERIPLSRAQEQLWFLAQLAPAEPTYNLVQASWLTGELDTGALRRALDEVVRRHEALRTVLETVDGTAYQRVRPPAPAELAVDDVSDLPAGRRRPAALALLQDREVHRPFDLAAGPLFRARLVRLGPTEHALAVAVHHIVVDGWSMGLLVRELAAAYAAYRRGGVPELAPVPLQYPDFARWQREHTAELDDHLRYWADRLADLPTLDLPTDRPRPATASFRGAMLDHPLDPQLHAGTQALAKETGASPFMVLVAGFGALLARYTGADDLAVGTTFSGRSRPELEPVVGFFANMGVLRLDTSGDPSFVTLVDRARDTCLGAWEHQDAPFERVVQRLAPPRDPSRNPLFQVAVQLLDGSTWGGPALPGTDSAPVDLRLDRSRFDLMVSLVDHGDRYSVLTEYSTDLFDQQRVRTMLEHLARLLDAGLTDPATPLSRLPMLAGTERDRVLALGAGPRRETAPATVYQLVRAQAERTPAAVALRHDGDQLTYRDLLDRAARRAARLRAAGLRPGDLVPVLLDRGVDEVLTPLAVWHAGGVYLPLDTAAPPNRLRRILTNAAARLVLTRTEHADGVPPGPWQTLLLDTGDPADGVEPEPSTGPDDLAYVLHTSGTTGDPKGVQLPHRGFVTYLDWMRGQWRCGPGDRVLHGCAPVFDLAAGEVLAALTSGATVVVIGKDRLLSPGGLAETLAQERITHLFLTPTTLGLAEGDTARFDALREVMVGGEVCPTDLVTRWARPGRRFVNLYGPTEATVGCLAYDCTDWTAPSPPPIGRTMPNRRTYVVDRWDNPVPVGVRGEILVGGAALSTGYLNDPELTGQRFTVDPFDPGGRVYRTGDQGHWDAEGRLHFGGRLDGQVKLRGLRIELDEIEAVLNRHPAVTRAAVTVVRDGNGVQRLVGYLVDGAGPAPDAALRTHLAAELPAHLVPGQFVRLPALPLTTSGKVNRRALPAPEAGDPAAPGVAAATPTERQVAEIFAEVLGAPRVGVETSFFDLGGHSLQAAHVLSRVAGRLGVSVPLKQFYATPTVRAVARLAGRGPVADSSPLVTLKAAGGRPRLYCPHAVSGSPYWYLPLSRALHPEQPMDGFEAPGLEGDAEPVEDLVALAARYVAALRQRQPHGPYLLAGWSMGGFLCFEMARQLAADGAAPDLVVMIDSNAPGPLPLPGERQVMETFVADLAGLSGTAALPLGAEVVDAADPIAALTAFLVRHGLIPPDVHADFVAHRYAVFRANMRAIYGYRPAPYPGRTVLVQAEQEASRAAWRRWAPAMEVVTLPGDHYSMWTPANLPALAALIDAEVRQLLPAG